MARNQVGEIVNSLPIEYMVAAPLIAAVKAQAEASKSLAQFVDSVALDSQGNARMVTFKYAQEIADGANGGSKTETRYIQAPFVALTGIPNLSVEAVQVDFELEVNTSDTDTSKTTVEDKVSGKSGFLFTPEVNFSASLSHSSEQTRKTDTRAKYSFHVEARKQEQPEALMRIVDAMMNAASVPSAAQPEDTMKELVDSAETSKKENGQS